MLKKETVRARITPELKRDVENVLSQVGLTMSEAIILFMSQVKLHQGLPFEIKVPNKETRRAIEEADRGIGLHAAKDVDDLFRQLNEED